MSTEFDVVIRGGTVIDGTGGPSREADVAVKDGKIAFIGTVSQRGREEIDARGLIVTPGFVDIHTHYDGQVTWENRLIPSSSHGVTTVVTGNCGVGFAPCRPHERETLVRVMEGVEDIPEVVMTAGIPWNWETFPEYLDSLEQRHFDIDVATQVGHSPVRVYVMGERGEMGQPASPEEMSQMSAIVRDAIRAGAFGVSTSQHEGHRTVEGQLAPSIKAKEDELVALAAGLRQAGSGVFQLLTDGFFGGSTAQDIMSLIRKLATASGRPVSYSLVHKTESRELPDQLLALTREARDQGLPIKAQVFPRPVGLLFGLGLSLHPFRFHPSYMAIHELPLAQRVAEMRKPERRKAILAEQPTHSNPHYVRLVSNFEVSFPLGNPPNYEPGPGHTLNDIAQAAGTTAAEVAYDLLLQDEGNALMLNPASNLVEGNLEAVRKMITDENTLIALGDGGAHYGMVCDSSYPTTLLAYWTRDRASGRVPLEWAIKRLTSDNAKAIGMTDRGELKEGLKADINVIDYQRLTLYAPKPVFDLPAGGRRLVQTADGYVATLVAGQVTYRNGEHTGALPGRLQRNRKSP
ncbi:N-acyl-D-aspartate/D-glutamate deacylase [Paraburkholderia sp. HC6.4b]|uniref:N-acyl-D-amino-acid deacylase family protein n=1 Tax=unclassified Paraburkholderia TaxID=2615204 RepID=UPI00160AFE2B|nr:MULTISPECIES: amidohydrolase family protein [unclassified Paraburkholderia]MBB5406329.1 N-acyl-D-aspartate/D-glutamate deacylase [Paraburkholderia sp. HC6.4b]MBB5448727.1 N-acyl-D-aspartate/D-glutamate deacylase [Paraburkholderia sp. Kb1A]